MTPTSMRTPANTRVPSRPGPADSDWAQEADGEGEEEEDPERQTQRVEHRAHEGGPAEVRQSHWLTSGSLMHFPCAKSCHEAPQCLISMIIIPFQ